MNLQIVREDQKEILRNLLEKYDYEFSQWDHQDINDLGLYGYPYLDYYWTEDRRWAYFIMVEEKIAGFAMVIDLPEVDDRATDFQLAEFFILYKYRRKGLGKAAFEALLEKHQGRWQLKRHPKNLPAARFWDQVIDEVTHGQFERIDAYPNTAYHDGSLGDIYFFDNTQKDAK